jgi:hypothetical protein
VYHTEVAVPAPDVRLEKPETCEFVKLHWVLAARVLNDVVQSLLAIVGPTQNEEIRPKDKVRIRNYYYYGPVEIISTES